MDFVLMLHSHLPYVLNHGRWPHGSDWLCEAALDTYLPLLEQLRALSADGVASPVTVGFTPVLANQLNSPAFRQELEAYFDQRLAACAEAPASLLHLADFWRARFQRLRALFHAIDGDLAGAFRALEDEGRIEIVGSAATHGYLPLLGRDESIRLQLAVGRDEHRRVFGRVPRGCWLPECAYRPRGRWAPTGAEGRERVRSGIEEHLVAWGFRYFFTDAHLAHAGTPLGTYTEVPLGAERFDGERQDPSHGIAMRATRSPYTAYRVISRPGAGAVAVLVRDPESSMQVWSRHRGYPGDEWYLEFHKIRWPGGLKFWRVTGPTTDLGAKAPYQPQRAGERADLHARHFTDLLGRLATAARSRDSVIVAPFDTELFGHWWFEGVDFLGTLYRRLAGQQAVRPVTASHHLEEQPPRQKMRLGSGSWGANGDDSMWLNPGTAWMWQRLWALEDAFWEAAPAALRSETTRPVLAQAARELLLAQASDWQFIISTGAVPDYAVRRFTLHCDDTAGLIDALHPGASGEEVAAARRRAEELGRRDDVFPNVVDSVEAALLRRQPARA